MGPLTSLAFVLLIEEPTRFRKSRDVDPYFGLVPRLDDSGEATPQLRISTAGDEFGRRLLVSAAQYVLGPAVARKLAVLLHQSWVSHATYDPDDQLKRRAA